MYLCFLCNRDCGLKKIWRNDKEVDFVLRNGPHIGRLVQVCDDMSSPKTEKRETEF